MFKFKFKSPFQHQPHVQIFQFQFGRNICSKRLKFTYQQFLNLQNTPSNPYPFQNQTDKNAYTSGIFFLNSSLIPSNYSDIGKTLHHRFQLSHTIGSLLHYPTGSEDFLTLNLFKDRTAFSYYDRVDNIYSLENNSVGRWKLPKRHIERKDVEEEEEGGGSFDMNKFQSVNLSTQKLKVSKELKKNMDKLETRERSLLMLTTQDSLPYLNSLDCAFPNLHKVGLVTPQLHFTPIRLANLLYHNTDVYTDGYVGLNLKRETVKSQVKLPKLTSLGEKFIVKKSQGNVLVELEGMNPVDFLMKEMKGGKDKFMEVWVKVWRQGDEQNFILVSVQGGEPGRGNLALNTKMEIFQGDIVQFFILEEGQDGSNPKQAEEGVEENDLVIENLDYDSLPTSYPSTDSGLILSPSSNTNSNSSFGTQILQVNGAKWILK